MSCVCGGEAELKHKRACPEYYILCKKCACGTPIYEAERVSHSLDSVGEWIIAQNKAAAAWNAMQAELQSGWTSEVPTEEGDYMFVGVYHGVKTRKPIYAGVVSYPSCLSTNIDGGSTCIENMQGHWFRINYPHPPED